MHEKQALGPPAIFAPCLRLRPTTTSPVFAGLIGLRRRISTVPRDPLSVVLHLLGPAA